MRRESRPRSRERRATRSIRARWSSTKTEGLPRQPFKRQRDAVRGLKSSTTISRTATQASKQLRSTKDLLGRTGGEFLLFGMITHSKEGKLCLEDLDGKVELDTTLLVGLLDNLLTLSVRTVFIGSEWRAR